MTTYLIYNVVTAPASPFFIESDWDTPQMKLFAQIADAGECVIVDVVGRRRYWMGDWRMCKEYEKPIAERGQE